MKIDTAHRRGLADHLSPEDLRAVREWDGPIVIGRPNQKSVALSDMTSEELIELADAIEREMSAL